LMLTIMGSTSVQNLNPKLVVFWAHQKWQMHRSRSSEQYTFQSFEILED
jgi:hypothetical protein